MVTGLEIEHLARYEQQYRENVVYPAVARRAQQEADLWLLRRSTRGAVRGIGVGSWLAERLVSLGTRLGVAPPRPATPSV